MKLLKKEKEYLQKAGYRESDFRQIQEAVGRTVYTVNGKEEISAKRAKELLGRQTFLSGLTRSAFHWSAVRKTASGETIHFDSSKLFQNREGINNEYEK